MSPIDFGMNKEDAKAAEEDLNRRIREILSSSTQETHVIGGAKSSKISDVRYDMVPQTFITRTAQRYALGQHYGDYNFRNGDEAFIRDRINHMQKHLFLFLSGEDKGFSPTSDDNLGAVAWCISFLMELQQTKEGREKLALALSIMNPIAMKAGKENVL